MDADPDGRTFHGGEKSAHVPGTIAHRDELWDQYYEDLMSKVRAAGAGSLTRLGGNFAHVLDETVDSRHNDATNESWLHGCFTYMLYRPSQKIKCEIHHPDKFEFNPCRCLNRPL